MMRIPVVDRRERHSDVPNNYEGEINIFFIAERLYAILQFCAQYHLRPLRNGRRFFRVLIAARQR
jgi:hypothetical protein